MNNMIMYDLMDFSHGDMLADLINELVADYKYNPLLTLIWRFRTISFTAATLLRFIDNS